MIYLEPRPPEEFDVMEDKREKEAISKVSELKVLSSRFKSKDDRSKNKKKSRKEVAKEEQEKKRFELEEVTLKTQKIDPLIFFIVR